MFDLNFDLKMLNGGRYTNYVRQEMGGFANVMQWHDWWWLWTLEQCLAGHGMLSVTHLEPCIITNCAQLVQFRYGIKWRWPGMVSWYLLLPTSMQSILCLPIAIPNIMTYPHSCPIPITQFPFFPIPIPTFYVATKQIQKLQDQTNALSYSNS